MLFDFGNDAHVWYYGLAPRLKWSNPDINNGRLEFDWGVDGAGLGVWASNFQADAFYGGVIYGSSSSITTMSGTQLNLGSGGTQGVIDFNSTTANRIQWGTAGVAAPGSSSAGMKLKFYGADGVMNTTDYAIGVESSNLWFNSNGGFKWYLNSATNIMQLSSGGVLTYNSAIFTNTIRQIDVATGVTVLDLNLQVGSTTNADRTIRHGREINTGSGALSSVWYNGLGSSTAYMSFNHKTGLLSLSASNALNSTGNVTINTSALSGSAFTVDYDTTSLSFTGSRLDYTSTGTGFGFGATCLDFDITHSGNAGSIHGIDMDFTLTGSSAAPSIFGYTFDGAHAGSSRVEKGFSASIANADSGAAIFGATSGAANATVTGKWAGCFLGNTAVTKVLQLGDGSVSAPAFTFISDTDLGVYRYTTNALGFTTGNALCVVMDASQRLGINTAPNYRVEAYGTNASLIAHYVSNSRGGVAALTTQRLALLTTASGDNLCFGYSSSTSESAFSTNFVERMRLVNSNGRLGIGYTSPSYLLDVNGDIRGQGYRSADGTAGWTGTVQFYDGYGALVEIYFKDGLGTGWYYS